MCDKFKRRNLVFPITLNSHINFYQLKPRLIMQLPNWLFHFSECGNYIMRLVCIWLLRLIEYFILWSGSHSKKLSFRILLQSRKIFSGKLHWLWNINAGYYFLWVLWMYMGGELQLICLMIINRNRFSN